MTDDCNETLCQHQLLWKVAMKKNKPDIVKCGFLLWNKS